MTSQTLHLEKCLFLPLAFARSNYITGMVYVEGHLMAKDLLHTVSDNFNDAENSKPALIINELFSAPTLCMKGIDFIFKISRQLLNIILHYLGSFLNLNFNDQEANIINEMVTTFHPSKF